ncbi:MAG: HlyD family secretion protein [Mangrovibacterium sp.]
MPQVDQIEQHSEEVQDIMGRIPGSLTRWGLTVIFAIFFSVIAGSYFFKFREIVSAPMMITTANPPAPLICKASGRIACWFVTDGQEVKAGDYIALIRNTTSMEDMLRLEAVIAVLDSTMIKEQLGKIILPEKLILGELQGNYNQFCKNWMNYRDYCMINFQGKKIGLLQQEMEKQRQYYDLSLQQQKMMEQEMVISEKELERYKNMLGKGGISESQMEEARAELIRAKRSYSSFLASLKSGEITMINQRRSLLEIQEQHRNTLTEFELSLAENIRTLKNQIKGWKETYLISSPTEGIVTLTKYWSENHVVSAGERLATVVPAKNGPVICRAKVSSSGIGQVERGQKVNIKLSGFPYMEHGMLTGTVNAVSLVPEEDNYIVEIGVDETMKSSYREQLRLVQEMEGTAEIITRENRLMVRFITPLRMLFSRKE